MPRKKKKVKKYKKIKVKKRVNIKKTKTKKIIKGGSEKESSSPLITLVPST